MNKDLKKDWLLYLLDVTLSELEITPLRTLPLTSQQYRSPVGLLELTARAGRLVGVRFGAENEPHFATAFASREDQAVLDQACEQLDEYFAGKRQQFDVPIAMQGTSFQTSVWSMLYRIPFGKMVSYQQMADALDRGCARSVGTANGSNPLPIFIPCHRVVQSDGSLGGYAGGMDTKQALLDLEYAGAGLFAATC
jgi:methylated-DNA-[protein]-cysteine S-methyltransferase